MNDQTIKADAGKLRLSLVPSEIIRAVARVREYGVAKYGEKESWREVEVERYREALLRHILAYKDDPDGVDEESGLPHLEHVACNVAFLLEMGRRPEKEKKEEKVKLCVTCGNGESVVSEGKVKINCKKRKWSFSQYHYCDDWCEKEDA